MLLLLVLVATVLSVSADFGNDFGNFGSRSGSSFGSDFGSRFGSSFGSSSFGSSGVFGNDPFFARKKPEEERGIGVCFIEIPTESVEGNKNVVLLGAGERPGMSRVRSCCKDYTMNPRNHLFCEPICSKKCRENSYCIAPELCGCIPGLARNLDGWCVETCPVSCQNGHCVGKECQCNPGYKLDFLKNYCAPTCNQSCGGGNCTAPNTCS